MRSTEAKMPPDAAFQGTESRAGEQRVAGCTAFPRWSPEDQQDFTKRRVLQAQRQKVRKSAGERRF